MLSWAGALVAKELINPHYKIATVMGEGDARGDGNVHSDGGTTSTWDKQYTEGSYDKNDSTTSMDIDIIDLSGGIWAWVLGSKGEDVFNGLVRGFQILHSKVQPVTGFRVRLKDVNDVYSGDNSWSDLAEALKRHDFDEPKHYLVIYDGRLRPSKIGSFHRTATSDGTMWHTQAVKGITGLSLSTTLFTFSNAYTRGLHQTMHNYINENIALEYADTDNSYKAVHQLGSSTSDARTVMADTYPRMVSQGDCSDTESQWLGQPGPETLAFSDCTLTAIRESIQANQP